MTTAPATPTPPDWVGQACDEILGRHLLQNHFYSETPGMLAGLLLQRAHKGKNDGRDVPSTKDYIKSCTALHYPTGTRIILTWDEGDIMHENPKYKKCFHLSLSFFEGTNPHKQSELEELWLKLFFQRYRDLVQTEVSDSGMKHYRVWMFDRRLPITATGAPYMPELTDKSDIQTSYEAKT